MSDVEFRAWPIPVAAIETAERLGYTWRSGESSHSDVEYAFRVVEGRVESDRSPLDGTFQPDRTWMNSKRTFLAVNNLGKPVPWNELLPPTPKVAEPESPAPEDFRPVPSEDAIVRHEAAGGRWAAKRFDPDDPIQTLWMRRYKGTVRGLYGPEWYEKHSWPIIEMGLAPALVQPADAEGRLLPWSSVLVESSAAEKLAVPPPHPIANDLRPMPSEDIIIAHEANGGGWLAIHPFIPESRSMCYLRRVDGKIRGMWTSVLIPNLKGIWLLQDQPAPAWVQPADREGKPMPWSTLLASRPGEPALAPTGDLAPVESRPEVAKDLRPLPGDEVILRHLSAGGRWAIELPSGPNTMWTIERGGEILAEYSNTRPKRFDWRLRDPGMILPLGVQPTDEHGSLLPWSVLDIGEQSSDRSATATPTVASTGHVWSSVLGSDPPEQLDVVSEAVMESTEVPFRPWPIAAELVAVVERLGYTWRSDEFPGEYRFRLIHGKIESDHNNGECWSSDKSWMRPSRTFRAVDSLGSPIPWAALELEIRKERVAQKTADVQRAVEEEVRATQEPEVPFRHWPIPVEAIEIAEEMGWTWRAGEQYLDTEYVFRVRNNQIETDCSPDLRSHWAPEATWMRPHRTFRAVDAQGRPVPWDELRRTPPKSESDLDPPGHVALPDSINEVDQVKEELMSQAPASTKNDIQATSSSTEPTFVERFVEASREGAKRAGVEGGIELVHSVLRDLLVGLGGDMSPREEGIIREFVTKLLHSDYGKALAAYGLGEGLQAFAPYAGNQGALTRAAAKEFRAQAMQTATKTAGLDLVTKVAPRGYELVQQILRGFGDSLGQPAGELGPGQGDALGLHVEPAKTTAR